MNEPLMSTPTNRTRRPGTGAGTLLACRGTGATSTAAASTASRVRMSGRLPGTGVVELRDQRARVLEVRDALERQVEEVAVRDQQGHEVERRGHQLHGRDEQGVEEPLALGVHPLELA